MEVDLESLRGTKRKADEDDTQSHELPRIRALAQDVVNKIAAGEIIVAPVHALKELLENAVDAGATSVEIIVKDGGLKLLQITDNGHGINREDLPILCERFTTSKLNAFEDLTSIGTYGFRGEALASISHIAHLTITTKTQSSSCAWKAAYADGALVAPKPGQSADPKACAGRPGTQITVEDLFYNVPSRRRAFRSSSEEYAKILDLVGRYAVHCSHVAFSCKKYGESSTAISVQSSASIIDRIRLIHGSAVASELITFSASSDRWGFKGNGQISNANYHVKKAMFLLFINHRSVESTAIKKAVEQTYSLFLPKGGHPFVYLSLEIEPQRVDVNVHPTKKEVNFLNEDEIIEVVVDEIRNHLAKVDTSRTFTTQSLLPGVRIPTITPSTQEVSSIPSTEESIDGAGSSSRRSGVRPSSTRPYENNLVRTDSKVRKITSMFARQTDSSTPSGHLHETNNGEGNTAENGNMEFEYDQKEYTVCRLTTIRELRAEVRDLMHNELTEVFSTHTFVGIVDEWRRIAAIQSGVKLFLIDYGMVCNEYLYQVGLTDFGNFGTIKLDPPLSLQELLEIEMNHEKTKSLASEDADGNFNWDEVVTIVLQQLVSRKEMLLEYFSIDISDQGELLGLPLLIKGYVPCMAKLPRFLLRLGPNVDWMDEKGCFHTLLCELASFYVPEPLPPQSSSATQEGNREEDEQISLRRTQVSQAIENVFFPAFKTRLVATQGMLKGAVEVANLKGLYRVFERC